MKIVHCKSLGVQQTYSPEMKSRWHNYVRNGIVHKNSHAVAYCLVAFRCLWLKAHFAPEFWAAVMSDCHPDKLVRYMSVARAEDWHPTEITYCGHVPKNKSRGITFGTLNINNLTVNYTVTDDTVNQGLIGIKKLGDKAAEIFAGRGEWKSIDEFIEYSGNNLPLVQNGDLNSAGTEEEKLPALSEAVDDNTDEILVEDETAPQSHLGQQVPSMPAVGKKKNKIVLERLIKLGVFKSIPGHENSLALWQYYQYKYCSGLTELKNEIKRKLLEAEGWNDRTIRAERERQVEEFKRQFPKRKLDTIIKRASKWMPKPIDTRERIMALYKDDYTQAQLLEFQKEFLGYYLDSPLELYNIRGNCTIKNAKEESITTGEDALLEVMVVDQAFLNTKPRDGRSATTYLKLTVTDGIQRAMIFIWDSELSRQDPSNFVEGAGIRIRVKYDKQRGTFSMSRGSNMVSLRRKD